MKKRVMALILSLAMLASNCTVALAGEDFTDTADAAVSSAASPAEENSSSGSFAEGDNFAENSVESNGAEENSAAENAAAETQTPSSDIFTDEEPVIEPETETTEQDEVAEVLENESAAADEIDGTKSDELSDSADISGSSDSTFGEQEEILTTDVLDAVGQINKDIIVQEADIPSDAVEWNGHYYKVYESSVVYLTEAEGICESKGGHLATITSSEEQSIVGSLAGLGTGKYIGAIKSGDSFKWVTGETWGYTNWASGEPNGGDDNSIVIKTGGRWCDHNMGGRYQKEITGYICEWDVNDVVITLPDSASGTVGKYLSVKANIKSKTFVPSSKNLTWKVTTANGSDAQFSYGDSIEETNSTGNYSITKTFKFSKAGTYTLKVTASTGAYDTCKITVSSAASKPQALTVSLSQYSYTYDGNAKKPGVTVKYGTKTLKNGTDYSVSYSKNTNAGTASVKVTGKGTYSGKSQTATFTIKPKNIGTLSASLAYTKCVYNGKERTPSATVMWKTKTLKKVLKNKTDYSVTYLNDVKMGEATAVISGKNNYTGTIKLKYIIIPRGVSGVKVSSSYSGELLTSWNKISGVSGYEFSYSTKSNFAVNKVITVNGDGTTSYEKLSLTPKKKYYVRVRAFIKVNSAKYYGSWSPKKSIKISADPKPTIKLNKTSVVMGVFTSKTVQLTATVTGKSKKVTYSSSNSNVAYVDKDTGKVTALASSGSAVITATANNVTATCTITVSDTAYKTVTLKFTTLEEWKTALKKAQQSLFPIAPVVIDLNTQKKLMENRIIQGVDVLAYKVIKVKDSSGKTIEVKCPAKIKYKIWMHIHTFKQVYGSSWYIASGGIVTVQTCSCGYRSESMWEIPLDDLQGGDGSSNNVIKWQNQLVSNPTYVH